MFLLLITKVSFSQERLFSVGYGKTFVSGDSSTLNLTVDVNRIPGLPEKAGGYYFLNEVIADTTRWRYYLKPMVDVNIGTGVSSAPNNIGIGLPFGFAYDFQNRKKIGLLSAYFEVSPEFVADKEFKNNLYFLTFSSYLKFEPLTRGKFMLNTSIGLSNSNGERFQQSLGANKYGRITVPVYLKMSFWNGMYKGEQFKRISWTNSFRFNHVYNDDRTITPSYNYTFFSSRLDFNITPKIAINITYFNGHEEPLFKKSHSLTFGISFSR